FGLLYWFFAAIYRNHEPLRITIFYRFGDVDYLPLIYSLARAHYSEFLDPSSYGTGLLPFPIVSLLPYALSIAIFGDAGFIVADGLLSMTRFLLVYFLIVSCTSNKPAAAGAALAVTPVLYWFYRFELFGLSENFFRYPRPYVTQLFSMAAIFTSFWLFRELKARELRPILAFGHGVLIGLAAQGNLYASVALLLATGLIFGGLIVFDGLGRQLLITASLIVLGSLAASVPLMVQSLSVPEDVLRRWGMFPHPRFWSLVYI